MEAWVEVETKIFVDSGRRLMEVIERFHGAIFAVTLVLPESLAHVYRLERRFRRTPAGDLGKTSEENTNGYKEVRFQA